MRSFWTKKVSKNEILFGARHRKEKFELLGTRNSWAVSRPPDGGVQDVHGLHGGRLVCPPQEGEVRGQRAVERLAVHVGPLGGAGASQMGGGSLKFGLLRVRAKYTAQGKGGRLVLDWGNPWCGPGPTAAGFFLFAREGSNQTRNLAHTWNPFHDPPNTDPK